MAQTRHLQFHRGPVRTIFLALLLIACASGTATAGTIPEHLYLLAGTPTNNAGATYPVDLYIAAPNHTLKFVREIVPRSEGLFDVLDDEGNKIYVAYPHIAATTVNIIHKDQPTLHDTVTFNSGNLAVDTTAVGVAAGNMLQSFALFPLLRRTAGGQGPISISLVSVAGDATGGKPRIRINDWSQYQSFRMQGASGGPMGPAFATLGEIRNGHVVLQLSPPGRPSFLQQPSRKEFELASVPPSIPAKEESGPFYIAVASRRFLAIGSSPGHSLLYIYDRKLHNWRVIKSAGTVQYAYRIFGSWLATIIEIWRPGNPQNERNPGRENERDWGNKHLPNVQEGYAFWQGRDMYIPGTLTLENLVDGRKITIETHQEDSEILDVRKDGLVLYRVNNEIFRARIEGDKLSAPKLVVKGEDVPEVHWAFWSKARSGAHPVAQGNSCPQNPLGYNGDGLRGPVATYCPEPACTTQAMKMHCEGAAAGGADTCLGVSAISQSETLGL